MKYILACLIIPIVAILLIVVFGFGSLYFGMAKIIERTGLHKNYRQIP